MSAVLPAQSKTDQSKIHQKRWKVEEVFAMKWTARSQQLFHRFRTEEFGPRPQVCAAVAASRLLRFAPQLQGTNLWMKRRAPGPSSLASLWPLLSGTILSSVGENGTELIWADSVSGQPPLSLCLSHGVNQRIVVFGLGDSHRCFCVWTKHLHWVRPWTFLLDVWQWLYSSLNGIHADLSCTEPKWNWHMRWVHVGKEETWYRKTQLFVCCGTTVESVSHRFIAWTFNPRIVRRTVPRVDVSVFISSNFTAWRKRWANMERRACW